MPAPVPQLVRRASAGEPAAARVVARPRGGTPQKRAAAMLVVQSGRALGTLGGECLGAEVRGVAPAAIDSLRRDETHPHHAIGVPSPTLAEAAPAGCHA